MEALLKYVTSKLVLVNVIFDPNWKRNKLIP